MVYSGSEAIGSARASAMDIADDGSFSTAPVPANAAFPDEIRGLVGRIDTAVRLRRAVEITRLVRHPSFAENQGLVFLLLRLVGHVITELDPDVVLSCVRRNHVPFYNRLCFTTVAGPRSYPGLNFTTYLLACSRRDYGVVRRVAPVLDVGASERALYGALLSGGEIAVAPDRAR